MYKRILCALLVVLMLFSLAGCGSGSAHIFGETPTVDGYKPFGDKGALVFENTDGLEKGIENEYIELYYNKETYVVTVFDKRSGKVYTTNPSAEQPSKSNTRLALLNLVYSDTQGRSGTIDSYTESVLREQVEVEVKGDTITFVYNIGDSSDGLEVTPSVLSNERFEELLQKADEKQQKIIKRRYGFVNDTEVWSRRKMTNPVAIAELVAIFKDIGYTAEDLAKDNAENGVAAANEEKLNFTVPLSFTLDGDSVVASIDLEKVVYPESSPLIQIEFMQFFGATGAEAQGYFLLPDGSGTVMPFDTVESGAISYSVAVYGADDALRSKKTVTKSRDAYMPIFGANFSDHGFLAVIEDGESLADVLAYNSGAADAYNKVYSRLNFLRTESVSLGEQQASDNFNYFNFQEECYNGNYTVRYILLGESKCGYTGMAEAYRSYLLSTGGLTDREEEKNSPFVLETVGGALSDKSFLGLQYKGITELTKYEDNIEMADSLKGVGVDNIKLRLTAFSGKGLQNMLNTKVKLIGNLGGNGGMKSLVKAAGENGFSLYPDFEYLTFSVNSGVVTKNNYALRSMDSKSVEKEILNPVTLWQHTQIDDNGYYLTALSKLSKVNNGVQKFLNKYGFKNMSIADMGNTISSDYTSDASYDRQTAVNLAENMLSQLSGDYSLMLSGANAKNIKHASLVTDAPLWSSQYEFTEGVPFWSMVYHGSVDYTGEAINLSADSKKEFLRCIEYGAALKYTLIYRNKSVIKNSDYTYLYSAGFEDNIEEITENYRAVNELYEKTKGEQITAHRRLQSGVYYTGYSNGAYTVVNYSDSDYTCEYGTVKSESYILG